MAWLILSVLVVALLLGFRWIYRTLIRGGVVEPTQGIGPHRRPFIGFVIRQWQDREDDGKGERGASQ